MKSPGLFFNETIYFIKSFLTLSGKFFSLFWRRPVYYNLIIKNMYDIGVKSFFIIASVGVLLSVVFTLHIGDALNKYGSKDFTPRFLILFLLSEAGVVISFILVGKLGGSITSEIASMKMNEELDALRALGLSPIKRVMIPKVLACTLMIPILVMVTIFLSILISAYVAGNNLYLDPISFIYSTIYTPPVRLFWFGMIKVMIFSFFMAITSCHYGFVSERSSYAVGKYTMKSVVTSLVLIIIGNFLLTKLYYILFSSI